MSSTILTNRVKFEVNAERINSTFDIWMVKTDLLGKNNYGPVVNKVYRELKPLSLVSTGKGVYVVLLSKGAEVSFDNPHYSLTQLEVNDLARLTCAKLLINAMPNLSEDTPRYSEGAGLFYLTDVEKIEGTEVLRTFEIKLEGSYEDILLKINGTTFTPTQYHTNAKGELYGDCAHLPRFTFDKWSQELTRSRGGEFIKKKHRDKKMKSVMVSLDTKYPGKFWKTKMGVLAQFIQDVERELTGMLTIEFSPLSSNYRVRFKDTDVKKIYTNIDALLKKHIINVVNLTDADTSPLEESLASESIPYELSTSVNLNALNLVIHHPKGHYESLGEIDPYYSLRSDSRAIVQSAYTTTLFVNKDLARSQYEACKKELFIKLEVRENVLSLIKPFGNWTFIRCMPIEEADNDQMSYPVLRLRDGAMSYCQLDENGAEELLLNLPGILSKKGYAIIDENSGDGFIFEETGVVAIPEFQTLSKIMAELEHSFDKGLPREWVTEFLSLLKKGVIEVKNTTLVVDKLTCLLNATTGKKRITKEVLLINKETRLSYRGSLQTFFDWVTVEKKLRFGVSLKSQNAGLIEAALGLFYNDEERLYFVGDKDNVKSVPRFCQIRRILTDANEVPQELIKMMEVFHIRHKQATVYPFPFKHLNEYFERAQLMNS
ncbi:MAG: hypothetical protein JKX76_15395 [Colwellia sp.]|nr:hypothetical protein [Colwellia sp.]